jgi:hypothetical protein
MADWSNFYLGSRSDLEGHASSGKRYRGGYPIMKYSRSLGLKDSRRVPGTPCSRDRALSGHRFVHLKIPLLWRMSTGVLREMTSLGQYC